MGAAQAPGPLQLAWHLRQDRTPTQVSSAARSQHMNGQQRSPATCNAALPLLTCCCRHWGSIGIRQRLAGRTPDLHRLILSVEVEHTGAVLQQHLWAPGVAGVAGLKWKRQCCLLGAAAHCMRPVLRMTPSGSMAETHCKHLDLVAGGQLQGGGDRCAIDHNRLPPHAGNEHLQHSRSSQSRTSEPHHSNPASTDRQFRRVAIHTSKLPPWQTHRASVLHIHLCMLA